MKKYLLLILCLVILITGCSNKKDNSISLKKGDIVVTCKSDNLGDSVIKMYSTVTSNFDKKKNIMNYKVETKEIHTNKKTFNDKKKLYDETYKDQKQSENSRIEYKVDVKNKTFTIISVINNINIDSYGEEEKKNYELSTYIKNYESGPYKCKVDGISRKKLGLK